MYLIVFPTQTLCDANASPLFLREQPQGAAVIRVEEVLRNHLEERFGENNVTVLILLV